MARKSLIGLKVVDKDGLELGYIDEEEQDFVKVSEGAIFGDWLRLHRTFLGDIGGKEVVLLDSLQSLIEDLIVKDCRGRALGVVRDIVAAGDVVDHIIVEAGKGKFLFVTLEDINTIGTDIALDITREEVAKEQKEKGLADRLRNWAGRSPETKAKKRYRK